MSTSSQLKSVHRRTLSELAARKGRNKKRLLSFGATLALLLSMTVVASVSANTGSITKSEKCDTGAVHVFLNNNVSTDRKVTVTSTIPGFTTTGITDKSYTTTGNVGPVEIWSASGPEPFAGVVTLTIKYSNNSVEFTTSTTLTAQEPCPKSDTSISTNASGTVDLSGHVSDTATLSGGKAPTGTITFRLYGPNDAICDNTAIFTTEKSVDGNGSYTSATFTPTAIGTYRWIASYSGDDNNKPAAGHCNDENEKVVVTTPPAQTSISTNASGTVELTGHVSDTATLSGGTEPGGTITFKLYGPNDANCDTDPVFTVTKSVDGNGDYLSGNFTPTAAGVYRWIASYSGDNNKPSSGACGDENEQVVVTTPPAQTSISTNASGTVDLGGHVSDTATLSGGKEPGGTITFKLYGPNDTICDSNPVFTVSKSVDGNGDYHSGNFTPTAIGTYRWIASYSGDNSNLAASGACNDDNEAVVVTQPEVETPHLTITKTNNAPIVTLVLTGGGTADLPTADEGSTVTYTLHYAVGTLSVDNGIITDVVPAGLAYVAGSATSDSQFTFIGYNAGTRTLTWNAETVSENGTLTYQAKVQTGASALSQPLTNTATIVSEETSPDSDTSDVFVPVVPHGETHVPTPPPTDTLAPTAPSAPGNSMTLLLAVLGILVGGLVFITPVPAAVKRRNRS